MLISRIARLGGYESKLFRWREGQPTFAIEKFPQAFIARTAFAADYSRGDPLTQFTAHPTAFQPVFVTDRTFNRDRGDF